MDRKKVLFVIDDIHKGGISKSLLNILPVASKYADCSLLVFNYQDLDKSLIPEEVEIIKPDERLLILGMSQSRINSFSKELAAERAVAASAARLVGGYKVRDFLFRDMPVLTGFDAAISYSQDVGWNTISTGCNQFVLECVEADKKYAFIHCDYSNFGGADKRQGQYYNRFDKIACVSYSCRESFVSVFPYLDEKAVVCENYTDAKEITDLAGDGIAYDPSVLNLVTVCRLGEEKGVLRVLSALNLIAKTNQGFHWTVVGDGPLMEKAKNAVAAYDLSAYVTLTGMKKNPYEYMKNADIFLLPSFHEAAPMVFGEANALGLPIITTETCSAREMVEDRNIGIVCGNSWIDLYKTLNTIIQDGKKPERTDPAVVIRTNERAEKQFCSLLGG